MQPLPPSSVTAHADRQAIGTLVALALGVAALASAAPHRPTVVLLVLASLLGIGWLIAATLLTWLCSGHGLTLEPPDLHGDFHALSRYRVRCHLANTRRCPVLFLSTSIDTLTDNQPLPTPPFFLPILPGRATATLTWDVNVRRRGPYRLVGARARTAFPGSLWAYDYRFSFQAELLALPAIYHLDRRALNLLAGRRMAGGRLHANPASLEEFIGARAYRQGDNPRSIHLALSLRRPEYPIELVVREYEDPSDDDVCLVLDTAISAEEAGDALLRYRHEKSICFAVALARLLVEQKYRVRFRTAGAEDGRIDLLLDRTLHDLPRLEARLARLTPISSRQPVVQLLDQETRRGSACLLFISLRETIEEKQNRRLATLTVPPDRQASLVREVVGL